MLLPTNRKSHLGFRLPDDLGLKVNLALLVFSSTTRHSVTDSIAYTFGQLGGLIAFTFLESERPDTKVDHLTFGFITVQCDALLLRVASATSNDFIEVELVSANVSLRRHRRSTVYIILLLLSYCARATADHDAIL